uniref:PH domain-containing protein n=1 Tax=Guillardia theta TaxID=55529 RepID=A0A7S4JIU6_GUITH|mmetsp:Transcript_16792/g.55788  ORF Transcript_16792/g.55788 Transcript_16792/m.55788 type:complete len:150 (+) Transcript_16792:48-497(+)
MAMFGMVMEYQAVKDEPSLAGKDLRIPARQHSNVDKAGKVWRQSSILKIWKERHVVVTKDSLMFWYTSEADSAPEDVISLKKATGVRRDDSANRPYTFIISARGGTFYQFSANSDEELESWLRVIGKAIVRGSTTEWDETSDRLAESQQ